MREYSGTEEDKERQRRKAGGRESPKRELQSPNEDQSGMFEECLGFGWCSFCGFLETP